MPRVSVIIPCWVNDEETWSITNACIDSFRTCGDLELILVDNASKVGGGWLRKCSDIYIRFPENKGFTVAMNAGLKVANGNYIFLANNDIRVPTNLIDVCIDTQRTYEAGFVYPKMIGYEEPFSSGGQTYAVGKERWCGNSLSMTTRNFLDRVGLFDEGYGIGGGADDWDYSHRVRQLGKQVFTSKTQFQHLNSFSLKKLGSERQKIVDQNNAYFQKKWGMSKEELFTKDLPGQMEQNYYEELAKL